MTAPDHMKSCIEITGYQRMQGSGPGSPLTQAIIDGTRALLAGGGHATKELCANRDAMLYTFTGPPELVRPITTALMTWLETISTSDSPPSEIGMGPSAS